MAPRGTAERTSPAPFICTAREGTRATNFYKMPRPDGTSVYVNPEHVEQTEPVDDGTSRLFFVSGRQEIVKLHQDDLAGRLTK